MAPTATSPAMTSPAVPLRDGAAAAAAAPARPRVSASSGSRARRARAAAIRNEERKARVRIDSMVPTRPSRAEASAGLSPAPWAAKTASTSGTSPSGVCWISLRSAHATGIFWRSGSWASSRERVPARAESLALASRLLAEHRRDQQQAEHQSRVAGRDRPAAGAHQAGRLREAGRAEDRERQPHARAGERATRPRPAHR